MFVKRRIRPFAHRGGASLALENSDRAVVLTANLEGFWLETDVRASSDGEVVLSHDASLARAWGSPLRVSDTPWDTLKKVRGPQGERLMRLRDVWDASPNLGVNIDPKDDAVIDPLIRLIRAYDATERVIVSSFQGRRIHRLRALAPDIPTGTTPAEVVRLVLAAQLALPVRRARAVACQIPPTWGGLPLVTRRVVATCHRAGLAVHVWTVEDEATMDALAEVGVDGIMSDRPDVLARWRTGA